jgi:hypothetical protein
MSRSIISVLVPLAATIAVVGSAPSSAQAAAGAQQQDVAAATASVRTTSPRPPAARTPRLSTPTSPVISGPAPGMSLFREHGSW